MYSIHLMHFLHDFDFNCLYRFQFHPLPHRVLTDSCFSPGRQPLPFFVWQGSGFLLIGGIVNDTLQGGFCLEEITHFYQHIGQQNESFCNIVIIIGKIVF
jgi:hypothetical protein